MKQRIAVGCDHGGLALKYELLPVLAAEGWAVDDLGCAPLSDGDVKALILDGQTQCLTAGCSVDYPDYAAAVAHAVSTGKATLGLLVCGSGIGMSIAANKVRGVRAALCTDPYCAAMARAHNDANILCLGGRVVGPELAKAILRAFVQGSFEAGRHQRRLDKITALEDGLRPSK